MVGVKERSGGYRPGAGRKPGSTQIKKPKSKATKKATKTGQASVADATNSQKLTAFFEKKTAAGGEVQVRAAASLAPSLFPSL